jgi:hypothetical protein
MNLDEPRGAKTLTGGQKRRFNTETYTNERNRGPFLKVLAGTWLAAVPPAPKQSSPGSRCWHWPAEPDWTTREVCRLIGFGRLWGAPSNGIAKLGIGKPGIGIWNREGGIVTGCLALRKTRPRIGSFAE